VFYYENIENIESTFVWSNVWFIPLMYLVWLLYLINYKY